MEVLGVICGRPGWKTDLFLISSFQVLTASPEPPGAENKKNILRGRGGSLGALYVASPAWLSSPARLAWLGRSG